MWICAYDVVIGLYIPLSESQVNLVVFAFLFFNVEGSNS